MKMPLNRATAPLRRGKYVLQKEGLIPFTKRGFLFLAWCLFNYRTYYVLEKILSEENEVEFKSRIKDLAVKIISTNEQIDGLLANGCDLGSYSNLETLRQRVNVGAVVFCAFVGKELAHTSCVATTKQANESIFGFPLRVDFSKNEASLGPVETSTKYRRLDICTHVYSKIFLFLRQGGKTVVRSTTRKSNVAGRGAFAKFGTKIYAEGRYLKILSWKSWKEKPINKAKQC